MARITVEDCLEMVDNRFQLVMIASKRARQLQIGGKEPLLTADKDKPTVIALREIAEGLVDVRILKEKTNFEVSEAQLEAQAAAEAEVAAEMPSIPEDDMETTDDLDVSAAPADEDE